MLCDYLNLEKENNALYQCGAATFIFAGRQQKEIYSLYKSEFEWIFDELESMKYPKQELVKIFEAIQPYVDSNAMDSAVKVFCTQVLGLVRFIAAKKSMSDKLESEGFILFEELTNKIQANVSTSLVFSTGV